MKKRRLIIAFLSMGVALSAASLSFSYAWYASGTQLHVEEIDVKIQAERRLTLSTKIDGEYKSDLVASDLNRTGLFTPVSTCFDSTWRGKGKPRFYDMSRPMWNLHGVPALFEANDHGYFSQELYLQCDDDVIATIDPELTFANYNETLNRTYAAKLAKDDGEYTEEEYLSRLNGIKNCARLSVLVDDQYLIYDPNSKAGETVYYGGALDNNNDGLYDFYQDPDDGKFYEVFYGEAIDRSKLVYLEPNAEEIAAEGELTAFNAGHAAGVHILDFEASKEFIKTEPKTEAKDFGIEETPLMFDLDRYTPKKVTVSFYLEGWDLDSVNGAMGSSFDLQLAFKILRER